VGFRSRPLEYRVEAFAKPSQYAFGDIDGDGDQDALLGESTGIVRVLTNGRERNFGSGPVLPISTFPHGVALMDWDRDGRLDAVVAREATDPAFQGELLLFAGQGDGDFSLRSIVPIREAGALFLADIHGDGMEEILVLTGSSADVYLWTETIVFDRSIDVAEPPQQVAVVAVDGNARPGILIAGTRRVFLLASRGDNGFAVTSSVAAGRRPSFAIGQFDGDPEPEVAVAMDRTISIHAIRSGAFVSEHQILLPSGLEALGVVRGDFDGDSRDDLAIATSCCVLLYLRIGDGGFSDPFLFGTLGEFVSRFSVVDWDLDRRSDLAFTDAGLSQERFAIFLNDANGTFGVRNSYRAAGKPIAVVSDDLDGDQVSDLITVDQLAGSVNTYRGRGDGKFDHSNAVETNLEPQALATGDIDEDGMLDAVVGFRTGSQIAVLLGKRSGVLQISQWLEGFDRSAYSLLLRDIDVDGHLDLVVSISSNRQGVAHLRGLGNGSFATPVHHVVGDTPSGLAIGDFNGDRALDIAVALFGDGVVGILRNRGDGTFASDAAVSVGGPPAGTLALATADLDADGFDDVVAVNHRTGNVAIVYGGEALVGSPQILDLPRRRVNSRLPSPPLPRAVRVDDIDADGIPDLLVLLSNEGVVVIRNSGARRFSIVGAFDIGRGTFAFTSSDFNRDGRLDIAAVNFDDDLISVVLGACLDGGQ